MAEILESLLFRQIQHQDMMISYLLPQPKGTNSHEFSNYRTISLLNSMSRLIESIVCFKDTGFSDACDISYKHQYCFRVKYNVSQPLLHFSNSIFNALNNYILRTYIFLDLKKALDTVIYEILLKKLVRYDLKIRNSCDFKII